MRLTMRATLRPMTSLSRGEPKQDDIPIPGLPARATAVSATQSPTELPIANTVSPRIPVVGRRKWKGREGGREREKKRESEGGGEKIKRVREGERENE